MDMQCFVNTYMRDRLRNKHILLVAETKATIAIITPDIDKARCMVSNAENGDM